MTDEHRFTAPVSPDAAPLPSHGRPRGAALFASALLALALAAAYLVAVVAVHLDRVFFPGNEIALPQTFKFMPGLSGVAPLAFDAVAGSTATLPADRINILVLGLDRRPSEGREPARSDTMFVLTLDPWSKTGGVLSIPRDLWVEIPDGRGGVFMERINTAYRFGGLNGYRGGPLQAVRDTVEHNFPQIHVDYTVAIDFASFIKVIDALGGIDILITEGFKYHERVSVDDRDGVLPEFKPGWEHMSGERALYYARFRDGPDGDFGRIRRQQEVMVAVANKILSTDGLSRAPELWARYREAIETDIPSFRVPGLALLAKQIGLDGVRMLSLGPVTRDAVTDGGADVLVADPADLARAVSELFYDARLRAESATIEVQNGTGRSGLARATASLFVQHGMRQASIAIANGETSAQGETVILNYGGKDYTAQRLAEWLGVPRSRVRTVRDTLTTGKPDIVVILGGDARLPVTAARTGPDGG